MSTIFRNFLCRITERMPVRDVANYQISINEDPERRPLTNLRFAWTQWGSNSGLEVDLVKRAIKRLSCHLVQQAHLIAALLIRSYPMGVWLL